MFADDRRRPAGQSLSLGPLLGGTLLQLSGGMACRRWIVERPLPRGALSFHFDDIVGHDSILKWNMAAISGMSVVTLVKKRMLVNVRLGPAHPNLCRRLGWGEWRRSSI